MRIASADIQSPTRDGTRSLSLPQCSARALPVGANTNTSIQRASETPSTLEARAVVRKLAQAVQHEIHDLLTWIGFRLHCHLTLCIESQHRLTEVGS